MGEFIGTCSDLGLITHQMILGVPGYLPVLFEGNVIGLIKGENAPKFCDNLRYLYKIPSSKDNSLFNSMSITLVQENTLHNKQSFFPGIYLSLNEGRFLRKVFNSDFNFIETIDPLEQIFLKISTGQLEHTAGHSHIELL